MHIYVDIRTGVYIYIDMYGHIYNVYTYASAMFLLVATLADWDLLHQSFYKLDVYPGRGERCRLDVSLL